MKVVRPAKSELFRAPSGKTLLRFAVAPFALFALGGCTASASVGPPAGPVVATGSAIMDWTIEGGKDPAACQAAGAASFHVALIGSAGAAGDFVQSCTAFATTVDGLAPDTYTGHADLLDANGNPRTTSVTLAPFDVVGTTTVTVALDFPLASFL
jgi:hypothetical protein